MSEGEWLIGEAGKSLASSAPISGGDFPVWVVKGVPI
jgi:hypothetical protein